MQPRLETFRISPPRRRLQVAIDVMAHAEAPARLKSSTLSNNWLAPRAGLVSAKFHLVKTRLTQEQFQFQPRSLVHFVPNVFRSRHGGKGNPTRKIAKPEPGIFNTDGTDFHRFLSVVNSPAATARARRVKSVSNFFWTCAWAELKLKI